MTGQAAGQIHQVRHPVVQHHLALVQFDDPVDQGRHLVQAVAGDEHGGAVLALGQEVEEDTPRLGIEVGRWLVEDQEVGLTPQGDTDEQFLLLPAGELDEGVTAKALHIQAQVSGDRDHPRRIGLADPGGEGQELAHRHAQGRRQLGHETDAGQDPLPLLAGIEPIDGHPALIVVLPQQAADKGGLAGAIGADERDAVAALDLQVDALEDGLAAEALNQLFKMDHEAPVPPPPPLPLVGERSLERGAVSRGNPFLPSPPRGGGAGGEGVSQSWQHQSTLSSPLTVKLRESVGQISTHRPQRVQSAPMSVSTVRARPRMVTSRTWGTMQMARQSPS